MAAILTGLAVMAGCQMLGNAIGAAKKEKEARRSWRRTCDSLKSTKSSLTKAQKIYDDILKSEKYLEELENFNNNLTTTISDTNHATIGLRIQNKKNFTNSLIFILIYILIIFWYAKYRNHKKNVASNLNKSVKNALIKNVFKKYKTN